MSLLAEQHRTVLARVDRLRPGEKPRSGLLDESHVAALAELEGRWPPIVVWAEQPDVVIDGAHRVAAARRLGHKTIAAVCFEGSADEAYVEGVRRNVEHGLPLSLQDRLRAGERILARHPLWSDRRIGQICALSPHTVARIRADAARRTGAPPAEVVSMVSRVGRDGRSRPARPGALRDRVLEAIRSNPGGSLRDIAAVADVSPETVRRIRRDVNSDSNDVPEIGTPVDPGPAPDESWRQDPALTSRAELSELLEWLDRTDPGACCHHLAGLVPLSRVYQVADEARRRAAAWTAFARSLEGRARRGSRTA